MVVRLPTTLDLQHIAPLELKRQVPSWRLRKRIGGTKGGSLTVASLLPLSVAGDKLEQSRLDLIFTQLVSERSATLPAKRMADKRSYPAEQCYL